MVSEDVIKVNKRVTRDRLNPCYSGRWSRRIMITFPFKTTIVLILVIAVDGLGGAYADSLELGGRGLNPCYSGRWSRRGSSQIPL